jgi:hypothetical protein
MAFMAQVRLADVPFLRDSEALLSFHYCEACTREGRMPWGKSAPGEGYSLDLFEVLGETSDALGTVTSSPIPASRVTLSEVAEVPDVEDFWRLEIDPPPVVATSDFDENLYAGLIHVSRSKLGGWPSWQQSPEWPDCSEGRQMLLVLQLDWDVGQQCSWASGGYAYVFTCPEGCQRREAELVVQTT